MKLFLLLLVATVSSTVFAESLICKVDGRQTFQAEIDHKREQFLGDYDSKDLKSSVEELLILAMASETRGTLAISIDEKSKSAKQNLVVLSRYGKLTKEKSELLRNQMVRLNSYRELEKNVSRGTVRPEHLFKLIGDLRQLPAQAGLKKVTETKHLEIEKGGLLLSDIPMDAEIIAEFWGPRATTDNRAVISTELGALRIGRNLEKSYLGDFGMSCQKLETSEPVLRLRANQKKQKSQPAVQ